MKFEFIKEIISEYCGCNSDEDFYKLIVGLQKTIIKNHEMTTQDSENETTMSIKEEEIILKGLAFALIFRYLNEEKELPRIASLTISKTMVNNILTIDLPAYMEWAIVLCVGLYQSVVYESADDIEQFKDCYEDGFAFFDEFINVLSDVDIEPGDVFCDDTILHGHESMS